MAKEDKAIALYSEAEKKAALTLAAQIGTAPAARELGTYPMTIRRWRAQMPEFWSDLQSSEIGPQRRVRSAESLEDLAEAYTDREFEALQRAEKLIKTADGKELAALMRAMGSSRHAATHGARAYRGEDVQTVEHNINFEALERAAMAILERGTPQPALPLQVENLAEADDASD
jgi:hypothetical protein